MDTKLLEVTNLKQHFVQQTGFFKKKVNIVKALDGVSFSINDKETLGLVGESGCGKSTLGKTILRLLEPSFGSIKFNGQDITNINKQEMRALRQKMQMIFQDPFASLNPRMNIKNILEEPLLIHNMGNKQERENKIYDLLNMVGLRKEVLSRYPHEFSGGQRQRIGIARSLAINPKFIVCDEPVSALDVSIQAQIINLLQDLQYQLGLTYLFIAHDLHVVKHIASRIAVMYLGNIVEIGDAKSVFFQPKHPYTQALLSAVPSVFEEKKSKRILLSGEIPSPINPPSGCKFHTRCPKAMTKCKTQVPILIKQEQQEVACFLYD